MAPPNRPTISVRSRRLVEKVLPKPPSEHPNKQSQVRNWLQGLPSGESQCSARDRPPGQKDFGQTLSRGNPSKIAKVLFPAISPRKGNESRDSAAPKSNVESTEPTSPQRTRNPTEKEPHGDHENHHYVNVTNGLRESKENAPPKSNSGSAKPTPPKRPRDQPEKEINSNNDNHHHVNCTNGPRESGDSVAFKSNFGSTKPSPPKRTRSPIVKEPHGDHENHHVNVTNGLRESKENAPPKSNSGSAKPTSPKRPRDQPEKEINSNNDNHHHVNRTNRQRESRDSAASKTNSVSTEHTSPKRSRVQSRMELNSVNAGSQQIDPRKPRLLQGGRTGQGNQNHKPSDREPNSSKSRAVVSTPHQVQSRKRAASPVRSVERKKNKSPSQPIVIVKRGRSSSVLMKRTANDASGTNWRDHAKQGGSTAQNQNIQIEVVTQDTAFNSPSKWNVRVSSDIPNSPVIVISSPATSGKWQINQNDSGNMSDSGLNHESSSNHDNDEFEEELERVNAILSVDNESHNQFGGSSGSNNDKIDISKKSLKHKKLVKRNLPQQNANPRVRMVYSEDSMQADFFIDEESNPDDDLMIVESTTEDNPVSEGEEDQVVNPATEGEGDQNVPSADTRTRKRTRKDGPRENTRKRLTHTSKWHCNIRKQGFNSGTSYFTASGKEKPAREVKPACSNDCNRCEARLTEEERQEIFDNFWSLESIQRKRDFITRLVDERVPSTCSTSPECARKTVRSYHFVIEDEEIKVCKKMFINTLGVQDSWVETSLKKVGPNGLVPDKRGKHQNRPNKIADHTLESVRNHINMFPRVASHYSRERTKREYLETNVYSVERMYKLYKTWAEENNVKPLATLATYRKIFNTEFNLGFFLPKKDQCELCAKWKKAANQDERREMVRQYGEHLSNKRDVRRMHNRDLALTSPTFCFACFDLQKILSCPRSEVSAFFYKNKLSLYNLTVYDTRMHEGHCNVWSEVDALKGANEVGTSVLKFISVKVEEGIKEFVFESDGPTGQNRNRMIFNMYLTAAAKYDIKITHRFLESGHSYSEADSMHAEIEKEAKRVQEIFSPDEWADLMRNAKQNPPDYIVKFLKNDEVLDLHELPEKKENWRVDTKGKVVKWAQVRELVFDGATPNIILYRYNFKDPMSEIHITLKEGGETDRKHHEFSFAYNKLFPLPENKKKDLRNLMKRRAIPTNYHHCYERYLSVV